MLALLLAPSSLVPSRPAVQTRRAALAAVPRFALGAAALSAAPLMAHADSIEEIAAKANAKARAEREAAIEAPPPVEQTDEEKLKPIITALAASVVLSVPFCAPPPLHFGLPPVAQLLVMTPPSALPTRPLLHLRVPVPHLCLSVPLSVGSRHGEPEAPRHQGVLGRRGQRVREKGHGQGHQGRRHHRWLLQCRQVCCVPEGDRPDRQEAPIGSGPCAPRSSSLQRIARRPSSVGFPFGSMMISLKQSRLRPEDEASLRPSSPWTCVALLCVTPIVQGASESG